MTQACLRPREALALRRQDVDASGLIHVQGSQGRLGRGKTKNPHSVRKVSVLHPVSEDRPVWKPKDAESVTRAVLDGLAVLVATTTDPEARLWPITHSRLDKIWRRVLKVAGVAFKSPHACRHSFASIMLARNAPLLLVQRAGGWRSATVLLHTYASYMPDEDAAATMPARTTLTTRLSETVDLTA